MATRKTAPSAKNEVSGSPVTAVYLCKSDGTRSWILSDYWVVYRVHKNRTYWAMAVIDWHYPELAHWIAAEFGKQYRVPLKEADPETIPCD